MLPESVLLEAQAELLDWQGLGVSVMEIGHRTPEFQALMASLEADFRALLSIPSDYHVLFLGGAARTQFSMVPMNLLHRGQCAGYLVSGAWSLLAYNEASRLSEAYCVASTESQGFVACPTFDERHLKANTAYLYYTPNETINGVRFGNTPWVPGIPLVADMTSSLLSEPLRVTDFGLIFAGTQKNIGIAGLTVVIIHSDLLTQATASALPIMMDYRTHVTHQSLYATPPTFSCYMASKMLQWIKKEGGVDALYETNCRKASRLYQYIDTSTFYHCAVVKEARSLVNVCFSLIKKELEPVFLALAKQRGLYALNGHRTVGGLRASLYNAMPMEGVEALVTFMHEFAEGHQ